MQLRSATDRSTLADEQAALRRVATLVAEGTSADDVFAAVAREVAGLFGVGMVNIDRYENGESVVLASFEDPAFPVGSRWPLDGPGVRTLVYETGRPARVDDFTGVAGTAPAAARASGIKSAVAVPIVVDGKVWGALGFGWKDDEPLPADTEQRLAAFTELVSTAIANAESLRELRLRSDEQAALRRVATLVARGVSQSEVLDAVAREVNTLFDAATTTVLRYEGTEAITVVASYGDFAGEPPIGTPVPLDGESVSAKVLRTGRPARLESFEGATGTIAALARELGVRSAVGAPFAVEGRRWVVTIGFSHPEPPPDVEHRLAAFTELAATAIANAESRSELAASEARARALANEQAALRRVATLVAQSASPDELFSAVATEVAGLIDIPVVAIHRYEADGTFTTLGVVGETNLTVGTRCGVKEGGIAGMILATGRPSRKEDFTAPLGDAVREDLRLPMVGVPIVVEGRTWGFMVAAAAKPDWPIPAGTEERLARFTELLATAIANAKSRADLAASEARAHELAEEQAALRRVATLVAQGASPDELFSAVAREVAGVIDIPVVGVHRNDADGNVTTVGIAGETSLTVGTRLRVTEKGIARMILSTGRPARIDDYTSVPLDAVREDLRLPMVGVPIVVEGSVWGFMVVASAKPDRPVPAGTEERLARFTELLATAIANAESRNDLAASEARAHELAEEQAALRRVATLVARGVQPHEIFSAVSEEVGRLFGSNYSGVGRFEPDGSGVVIVGVSEGIRNIPVGTRWPLEDFLATTAVYRTGRPARNERSGWEDESGPVANSLRELGLVSTVAAPIVVEGNVWGIVTVSDANQRLPPDAEERVAAFTELVATAIANAESRAELAASEARAHELAEEQAALRRVATLVAEGGTPNLVFDAVRDEVARMFNIPSTVLMRFDADGKGTLLATYGDYLGPVGTRWPLAGDTSAVARVHQTGRAARANYTNTKHVHGSLAQAARRGGVRYPVAVPVVVEGALWGAMSAGSYGPEPPDLEGRLAKFTELLATAIANAESRADLAASEARARELAEEQAALRRVATLVARGASPDVLFSAVAEEVAGIIDVPLVGIHRYEADGTHTALGIFGETSFTVGSRQRVQDEEIDGMILATGRPARKDAHASLPGPLGETAQNDRVFSTVGVPIVVEGSVWGLLVAASKRPRPIPADTDERLARFTELVATAISNATTRDDLLTSRARLVSAADETRRRLERDLHDGIQQWLVALALRARKAAALSAADESAVRELSGLADDLVAVVDELRELSRGIHPAILSDSGLDDALKALARRSAIRVDLDVSFQDRYDPTLEATVYYVAAESITNAVKHAQASTVTVRGGRRNETVELEIRDDGVGGADPHRGSGLIGLKDRVDTLGGTISFASPAGAGTTIRVKLPAGPRGGDDPPLPRRDEAASGPASG